jgi:GNAT superfamily N-acetyltransferase
MNIRTMTAADIPFAMRLKVQNGWNQLEGDWRRQLELEPAACFVAEVDEQPVGTACACVFDDVAWINFVLVDQTRRGNGIGTALMRHVVHQLDERGVFSIRLDATPLGQPVYEKLGFAGDFALSRYEGILRKPAVAPENIEPFLAADLPAVCALDETVTKTRREKLLRHLCEAFPALMHQYVRAGRLEGFCMCRPGSKAWQLGPLQGTSAAAHDLMADAAIRRAGQRVYVDVPTDHAEAVRLAQLFGLQRQRSFLRMTRGRRLQEKLEFFWSSFGPEKG